MDNIEENKIVAETLNSGGDTVVVKTTTVVEHTKITIVENFQEEKKDDLFGGDEGDDMKADLGDNGGNLAMDVEGFFTGGNGDEVERLFEGNEGYLADDNDENVDGDPMDVFEFKEDTYKNDEGMVENGEQIEGGDDEEEEEEDHDFVVGDLVWGKIKSHPWWPGQIYDPSDASEYAVSIKRRGHLLVVYFGDGSFSWCKASQLKAYIDDFQEMSNKSDSKNFVTAVKKSLEQVSKHVRAELMCKCQPVCPTDNVNEGNSGIKKGVAVPKGNTIKVLIDRMQPVELLSMLKNFAIMEPDTSLVELELTVLKSWISAFYGQKGGYLLPEYHDPEYIEGLDDESKSAMVGNSDKNGGLESTANGDDKLSQRRKKKSVADLLGEDEPKVKKAKMSKDGGVGWKRKGLVVSVTPESDHESGLEDGTTPRQRKRSKYLSPPYLSPASGKLSGLGSGSFKEPKADPEEVPEMDAEEPEGSSKKSNGKRGRKKRVKEGSDLTASVDVEKLLQGLLRAALDPSSFVEKNLPAIIDFISLFRKQIFENVSNGQVVGKKEWAPGSRKAASEDVSDFTLVKEKLEAMRKTVQACGEEEMKEDIKAYLEGGLREALEKLGTIGGV
uniref:uncharacterized protein LOC122586292 n=1 Tax=Erigeron canadensis TaxID=72917 RepID=UPI001CB8A3ED|nr:uncharacterized protein LOC122586292 [Erigeron canadensis]